MNDARRVHADNVLDVVKCFCSKPDAKCFFFLYLNPKKKKKEKNENLL